VENRQQLTERALRYIFEHKKLPDYSEEPYNGLEQIGMYTNQWHDVILYNRNFGSTLALISAKQHMVVSRKDTVFLGILQEFAAKHGYKLRRPPNFPKLGDTVPITEAPDLYPGEVPMTT